MLCRFPNLHLLESTFQMRGMHTIIRDKNTIKGDFIFMADRLIRLVRPCSHTLKFILVFLFKPVCNFCLVVLCELQWR